MQLVSNCGAFVIDYYPVKSIFTKNLIPDLNLKVVSNYGRTLYKELLNDYACGDDIITVSYTHLTLPTIYSV